MTPNNVIAQAPPYRSKCALASNAERIAIRILWLFMFNHNYYTTLLEKSQEIFISFCAFFIAERNDHKIMEKTCYKISNDDVKEYISLISYLDTLLTLSEISQMSQFNDRLIIDISFYRQKIAQWWIMMLNKLGLPFNPSNRHIVNLEREIITVIKNSNELF